MARGLSSAWQCLACLASQESKKGVGLSNITHSHNITYLEQTMADKLDEDGQTAVHETRCRKLSMRDRLRLLQAMHCPGMVWTGWVGDWLTVFELVLLNDGDTPEERAGALGKMTQQECLELGAELTPAERVQFLNVN
jgi:hypothetical protein